MTEVYGIEPTPLTNIVYQHVSIQAHHSVCPTGFPGDCGEAIQSYAAWSLAADGLVVILKKEKSIKLLQFTKAALEEPFFSAASPPHSLPAFQRLIVSESQGVGRRGKTNFAHVQTIDPGHSGR